MLILPQYKEMHRSAPKGELKDNINSDERFIMLLLDFSCFAESIIWSQPAIKTQPLSRMTRT